MVLMSSALGFGVRLKIDRRHDLPRVAVAALRHVLLDPGALHRVEGFALRQTLDRGDALAGDGRQRRDAERMAAPSTCTVQAPQAPMPQPNLVPESCA